jgi:hypothetical protein
MGLGTHGLNELEATEDFDIELKRFNNLHQLLPSVMLQPAGLAAF